MVKSLLGPQLCASTFFSSTIPPSSSSMLPNASLSIFLNSSFSSLNFKHTFFLFGVKFGVLLYQAHLLLQALADCKCTSILPPPSHLLKRANLYGNHIIETILLLGLLKSSFRKRSFGINVFWLNLEMLVELKLFLLLGPSFGFIPFHLFYHSNIRYSRSYKNNARMYLSQFHKCNGWQGFEDEIFLPDHTYWIY